MNGSGDPLFFQVTCYSFVDCDVVGTIIPERDELLRQWKLFGDTHNASVLEEAYDSGGIASLSPSIAEKASDEPHRSLRWVASGLFVDYFRLALKVGKSMYVDFSRFVCVTYVRIHKRCVDPGRRGRRTR